MTKFHGDVGYGEAVETPPGSSVYVDQMTKRSYFGDVIRNTRQLQEGPKVNSDLAVSNTISVVADAYAYEYFFNIRYIRWMGVNWTVTNVEVQRPRLVLSLGEVYNGPTAT